MKEITFEEFLLQIPVTHTDLPNRKFNTIIDTSEYPYMMYRRVCVPLRKTPDHPAELESLKMDLISQANIGYLYKAPMDTQVDIMCSDHRKQYGSPTCLVNIAGMWLVANPDDYRIYRGDGSVSLACYAQVRNTLYEELDETLEEVQNKPANHNGPWSERQ